MDSRSTMLWACALVAILAAVPAAAQSANITAQIAQVEAQFLSVVTQLSSNCIQTAGNTCAPLKQAYNSTAAVQQLFADAPSAASPPGGFEGLDANSSRAFCTSGCLSAYRGLDSCLTTSLNSTINGFLANVTSLLQSQNVTGFNITANDVLGGSANTTAAADLQAYCASISVAIAPAPATATVTPAPTTSTGATPAPTTGNSTTPASAAPLLYFGVGQKLVAFLGFAALVLVL